MHDLNDALDELRTVIPYAHSPSVRKLSKIATLLLAKNYILMQGNALEEMRKLVSYLSHTAGVPIPCLPSAGMGLPGSHPFPLPLHSPQQVIGCMDKIYLLQSVIDSRSWYFFLIFFYDFEGYWKCIIWG